MTVSSLNVTLAARVTPSDEVLVQQVGEETVLLDLASERYFGLDQVGTRIWELVADGASLQDIAARLADEFDAPRETIEADLLALLTQLTDAGLVTLD